MVAVDATAGYGGRPRDGVLHGGRPRDGRVLPDGQEDADPEQVTLAEDQLHWVMGLNPFDASMIQGRGRNNVEYSTAFQNVPGGILNGVTSGFNNERGIAFMPAEHATSGESWRWAEQWIPHSAWFLLAISAVR